MAVDAQIFCPVYHSLGVGSVLWLGSADHRETRPFFWCCVFFSSPASGLLFRPSDGTAVGEGGRTPEVVDENISLGIEMGFGRVYGCFSLSSMAPLFAKSMCNEETICQARKNS